MDKTRVDWQTALVGLCSVVMTLFGTSQMVQPLEGNQREITKEVLKLSEANKDLNQTILGSVSRSEDLNKQMLKVVEDRSELFRKLEERIAQLEKKLSAK
jgi:hypothetical protein